MMDGRHEVIVDETSRSPWAVLINAAEVAAVNIFEFKQAVL